MNMILYIGLFKCDYLVVLRSCIPN